MNNRILVTGANGQLGQSIKKISHEYHDFEFVFVTRKQLDLSLSNNIKTYFEGQHFSAIINCAAYTAVDKAENEKELAEQINHYAVRQLAQIASKNETLLVHISTDYVFNGQSTSPYNETNPVGPKNIYGSSKLNGENSMQATDVNGYIIRTSWVYSEFGNNFVKTMLNLGKERDSLNVVYEQIGSPTYATDLARAILSILKKNQNPTIKGIKLLHYSNEGVCSWFDFAKHIIGESFIGDDDVCLVLGDNIFYGHDFKRMLRQSVKNVSEQGKATVFGYYVRDPERYGVAEFDKQGNVLSIEEKPENPKSSHAVVGLYFYPNNVIEIAKSVKPSHRGELEITSVNQAYLEQKNLKVELMGRGFAWLDTGTHESLMEASNYIQTIENRQGLKVACLEEIAYEMGYINKVQLISLAEPLKKNQYGQYLLRRVEDKVI